MPVLHIKTASEFNNAIQSRVALINFFATWCGPCKRIAPILEGFSNKYPTVVFAKLDVDELEDVAAKVGISAMPTFKLYEKGKQIDELVGADEGKLRSIIAEYA